MMKVNKNFEKLEENYLFSTIKKKVKVFRENNPTREVYRLGIGDVTLPIPKIVVKAMKDAVNEFGNEKTFHGYGDEQGNPTLRQAIAEMYIRNKAEISPDEVFISDGAKSDLGNILDIFAKGITAAIPNPVYPAYVDANIINGNKIIYMNATKENVFLPMPKDLGDEKPDLIYICSPNNPTGAVYSREQLEKWVDFANENQSFILYDSAYSAFIKDENLPKSIFEIKEAKSCAIEISSFSKCAGFTGLRCGWTIIPKTSPLYKLWARRQSTKFNGASYPIQCGAQAALSAKGQKANKHNIEYYMKNAKIISKALEKKGIEHYGGENAPYIWLKCTEGQTSWEFFDTMLERYGIVGTAGSGFGSGGEGWFRLSAFASRKTVTAALSKLTRG
jgi:LL-diaminopimelate aminotransferase